MKRSGVVTLLTDFGLKDPYVAMMKGAILSIHPEARIMDVTHHIPPGDIGQAAHTVKETYPYFPDGTVHVAVVDPGVGTDRRAIVLSARSHLFVGPDNGIFWPIIEATPESTVVRLSNPSYFLPKVSRTFHGRDIFAPVAAHLSRGAGPMDMGPVIHDPIPLTLPIPRQDGEFLYGEIVRVDHFGNLITNIRREDLEAFAQDQKVAISIGDLRIEGIRQTYGQASRGEPLALFDSSGHLEIAVNSGRAAGLTGLDLEGLTGRPVRVGRMTDEPHHS